MKIHDLTDRNKYPKHDKLIVNPDKTYIYSNVAIRRGDQLKFSDGELRTVLSADADNITNTTLLRNRNMSETTMFYAVVLRKEVV